ARDRARRSKSVGGAPDRGRPRGRPPHRLHDLRPRSGREPRRVVALARGGGRLVRGLGPLASGLGEEVRPEALTYRSRSRRGPRSSSSPAIWFFSAVVPSAFAVCWLAASATALWNMLWICAGVAPPTPAAPPPRSIGSGKTIV